MAATVKVGGDTTEVVTELKKINSALSGVTQNMKRTTDESKQLSSVASRAFRETATHAEKITKEMKDVSRAFKAGKIDLETYTRRLNQLESQLNDSSGSANSFGKSLKDSLTLAIDPVNALQTAFRLLVSTQEDILENSQKIAEVGRTAAESRIPLAALQQAGRSQEAINRSEALGAEFGLLPQQINPILQSIQSGGLLLDEALKETRLFLEGTRVGISAQVQTEIAAQAAASGIRPSELQREVFVAGEASSRTPEDIGRAVQSLASFSDREFGLTVLAQLVGTFGQRTREITENVSRALGDASSLFGAFEELGVGAGSTREQRLSALSAAGLNTEAGLRGAGLTEITQITGLLNLIKNRESFLGIQQQIQDQLQNKDIVSQEAARIASEVPGIAIDRDIGRIIAERNVARASNTRELLNELQRQQEVTDRVKRGAEIGPFGSNLRDDGSLLPLIQRPLNALAEIFRPGGLPNELRERHRERQTNALETIRDRGSRPLVPTPEAN